jgi:pilus assembly protein FimV
VVRRSVSSLVALIACLTLATAADAAGLGRLAVLSALGQPLAAEVEVVSVQPGEEEGLTARLATSESFQQAGIEINPVLNGARITIEHRDQRPYLRITTRDPVNEPFLDLLIELQWPSGRLVREYTFLLDPPEYRSREQAIAAAPAPAVPPVAEKPAAPAEQPKPQPQATPTPPPAAEQPRSAEQPPAAQPTPAPARAAEAGTPKPEAEAKPEAAANTYEVKSGDTLGAIAKSHLPPGVSLNQMLIALFRANEGAFMRGNMNLVRTGRILNIPEGDSLGTVDRDEATRLVKEQYAQFQEYRSRLAAVPTPAEGAAPQREVTGRIEERPAAPKPAAPSDELRLSKTEPGKPAAPGSRAAREDDQAARERALQEAQSRQEELEKNVADLQKLLALKNQQLAELEKKGGAKPAPVPPAAAVPEKPAAEAPKAAAPPAAPPPVSAEAPKPAPEAPKPAAEAPKPPPAQPKPAAKKAAPPPPEPSILDELLDNPMYTALAGALVLLLLAYFVYSWRRKKKAQAKFQDSVFGAAAAGSASASLGDPTAPAASMSTASVSHSASQPPAGMEAEEVDPIAEADVYMAYGRDAQAEEILKEALQKDSKRTAVHGKLLEIYAHRKDNAAFEQSALKLKNLTNGTGPEWEKAAALGRSIDSRNSLYGSGARAEAPAPPAPSGPASGAPTLDFDLGGPSQSQAAPPDISLDEPAKDPTAAGLDLDLGATQTQKLPAADEETMIANPSEKSGDGGLDFNLDLGTEEKHPGAGSASAPAAESNAGLDFDLNLDSDKNAEVPKPAAEPTKIDLSAISLDLDSPSGDATLLGEKASGDSKWQEVATKLDLAKAYEEMGDKDGARELLREVVKDGDPAQRGSAEQLLAKLG